MTADFTAKSTRAPLIAKHGNNTSQRSNPHAVDQGAGAGHRSRLPAPWFARPPCGGALAAGRLALPPSSAAAAPVIQNLASVLYGRQAGHTKLRLLYGWGGSGVARRVSPLSPPSRPRRARARPARRAPRPFGAAGALGRVRALRWVTAGGVPPPAGGGGTPPPSCQGQDKRAFGAALTCRRLRAK